MKEEIVSVIIPVFNGENFIERALLSVINQTYNKLEIIIIDDGSTDNSPQICDEYAKKDKRLKIIHKINEGVTVARKTGVDNASGEWIYFVDSDDELPENSIKLLYTYAKNDVDMVIGSFKYVGHKKMKKKFTLRFGELNDAVQFLKLLLKMKIHGGPCARLIKKNLFDSSVFCIPAYITEGEDFIMNIRLGQKIKRVILLPDIVYHYIWRPGSAIAKNSFSDKKYRTAYYRLLYSSICFEYRKILKTYVIYHYLITRWYLFKFIIKKLIWNLF